MKTLALDARPAQCPPHSYRRLLELFYEATQKSGIPTRLLTNGPLHKECAQWESEVQAFPKPGESLQDQALWCLTPDPPPFYQGPYISMICDVNPLLPDGRSRFQRWMRARAFRKKVAHAMRHAWKIATDSEDAKNQLRDAFPGIEPKLHVIPLYAASSFRSISLPACEPVLKKHELKPGYLFFVGSFRRHKNWEGLMAAYALLPNALREKHPLVFSGAVKRDLVNATRLMEELGIREYVTILGETPEADMAALYSAAGLFVFPSFMEGFGLPPLEAMQCGTPVVASDRTSIPEVLGYAARYFDPADTEAMARVICEVLEDDGLQAKMINAGFSQASRFGAVRTGEAIKAMLEF